MRKRGLLLLLVSAVLTGCQPSDISSVIGDVLDKEETVEADDAAEAATDAGASDNSAGESASVNSAAEDDCDACIRSVRRSSRPDRHRQDN